MSQGPVPVPRPFRPGMGVPGVPRSGPVPGPPSVPPRVPPRVPPSGPAPVADRNDEVDDAGGAGRVGSGHPAVDAVLQAMANAANLPPADQIAQYEDAHRTLRETLATIDQA